MIGELERIAGQCDGARCEIPAGRAELSSQLLQQKEGAM
jgi:hypothetical protein